MMLSEYHRKPFDLTHANLTFADVYYDTMAFKEKSRRLVNHLKRVIVQHFRLVLVYMVFLLLN